MGLTAVLVIIATAGLIWSSYQRLKANDEREAKLPSSPAVADAFLRTTAHEAGHALVGWFSTVVTNVTGIENHGYRAITRFMLIASPRLTASQAWEVPRLYLAGIAAERLCFGDFEAEGALSDINVALQAARSIIEQDSPHIEHERATTSMIIPTPDFALVYPTHGITPAENEVLRLAYTKAAEQIIDNNKGFRRLWHAMTPRREEVVLLSQEEISACFGPRIWAPK